MQPLKAPNVRHRKSVFFANYFVAGAFKRGDLPLLEPKGSDERGQH